MRAANELAGFEWAALRLTISRGEGPRGYAPPESATPRIIITAAPLQQDRRGLAEPLRLGWSSLRWSSQPVLAGIKHLNRIEQVLVSQEIGQTGMDDLVVLDQRGYVCSLSAGNLFMLESGQLLTPALETCGIAGTRRRLVLEEVYKGVSSRFSSPTVLALCNSEKTGAQLWLIRNEKSSRKRGHKF